MWLRSCVAVAAAVALIQPLVWKLPYAADVAIKRKKKKKEEKRSHEQHSLNDTFSLVTCVSWVLTTPLGLWDGGGGGEQAKKGHFLKATCLGGGGTRA